MTDKSINASRTYEKADSLLKSKLILAKMALISACMESNPDSKLNNAVASGITSQDAIERA